VALPEPRPGLVIRYDYLWSREAAEGRQQSKDRPACLVTASDSSTTPRFVVILPITHSSPRGDDVGNEIPHKVRRALGLDDAPSWVLVSDHNVDEWPNAGLAAVPGRPEAWSYGFIPPGLFAQIKARFLELAEQGRSTGVRR
jgi:hypothetical protein